MAQGTYKRVNLDQRRQRVRNQFIAGLAPGYPMESPGVHTLMAGQDDVLGTAARILLDQGLDGSKEFMCPDGAEPDGSSENYPEGEVPREIGNAKLNLTPGSFPAITIAYLPSALGVEYTESEEDIFPGGTVRVEIVFTVAGVTDTTTLDISLPASQLANNGEPDNTARGAAFLAMNTIGPILIVPPDALQDTTELAKWCYNTEVEITVHHINGPRIVDLCIFEMPIAFARAHDATTVWAGHAYSDGTGGVPRALPTRYPVEEADTTSNPTEPRFGTFQVLDVTHQQGVQLGPTLFSWNAHNEYLQTPSVGRQVAVTISSTSLENVLDSGKTEWTDNWAGFNIGNYARDFDSCCTEALRGPDRDGSIPVIVRALCLNNAGEGNNDARVRVQASEDSWLEIEIAGTVGENDPSWSSTIGHLRCGVNPEDDSNVQILANADSGGSINVYAVTLYWGGVEVEAP